MATGTLCIRPALRRLLVTSTGFALAAALLNAVFDFCLGCELYLLGARVLGRRGSSR